MKAFEYHTLRADRLIGSFSRPLEDVNSGRLDLINLAHLFDQKGKAVGDVKFVVSAQLSTIFFLGDELLHLHAHAGRY